MTAIGTPSPPRSGSRSAVWISEYRRPRVDGPRDRVGAGNDRRRSRASCSRSSALILFARGFLGFLSQQAENGSVTGESFITAGLVMSLLALPMVVAATRESLSQIPGANARGLLRAGQDAGDDDPQRAAAGREARR